MATCRLHGERKGPSDWSQAAGKPASVGRAVCSINAWRFFATTPSRDTTHLRGIPAARDQSAGSPHTPHTLYFALPPEGSLGGVPRGFCLPPDLVAPNRCTCERPEKGPCFAFHPPSFPCAYAGSDGCPVFTRETSPVKWCGLYTGAAVRGRSVPVEEVHLAEIQA